jgi:alpha-tubulin suppressor-like RCC1 family protein
MGGAGLLDLPLEVLTQVCQHLGLSDLVRVAQSCKCFRHGGLETVKLPTESPVVTILRELAFPCTELVPLTRPVGCSESWVAYLARCARQRRFRETPPIAVNYDHSVFVDASGRLMACGEVAGAGLGDEAMTFSMPTAVATMAGVRMRSVAAGFEHSLALSWDGRVYSWGRNEHRQLGHGGKLRQRSPRLVEGLESARGIVAHEYISLAVTASGRVFRWGQSFVRCEDGYLIAAPDTLRPVLVEGFEEARVRCASTDELVSFAIGEEGELFSWGFVEDALLAHGHYEDQPVSKRVEALRGVRVSYAAAGKMHAVALAEDGLVYSWGENRRGALLGDPHVERELLPKPVEALRGVRVTSFTIACLRNYAVADTGELWVSGQGLKQCPLGHGEQKDCLLPKPISSLRGVKVDVVATCDCQTVAVADDGSMYAWGNTDTSMLGALGLGSSGSVGAPRAGLTAQRIPALRVACGF